MSHVVKAAMEQSHRQAWRDGNPTSFPDIGGGTGAAGAGGRLWEGVPIGGSGQRATAEGPPGGDPRVPAQMAHVCRTAGVRLQVRKPFRPQCLKPQLLKVLLPVLLKGQSLVRRWKSMLTAEQHYSSHLTYHYEHPKRAPPVL